MGSVEDLEARVEHLSIELDELRKEHKKLKEAVEHIPGWFKAPEDRIAALEAQLKALQRQG